MTEIWTCCSMLQNAIWQELRERPGQNQISNAKSTIQRMKECPRPSQCEQEVSRINSSCSGQRTSGRCWRICTWRKGYIRPAWGNVEIPDHSDKMARRHSGLLQDLRKQSILEPYLRQQKAPVIATAEGRELAILPSPPQSMASLVDST